MVSKRRYNRTVTFNLRLTERERQALHNLEELEGLPASEVIRNLLQRAAERAGVWPELVKEKEADDENDR